MPSESIEKLLGELQSLRVTLEGLRVTLTSLVRITEDHESRVRVLERRAQSLTPVLSALTFLLGVVATELVGRLL